MSDVLSAILICWVNKMGGRKNVVGRDKSNGGGKDGKRQKGERFAVPALTISLVSW
jgi:hypothetical protein